MKLIIGGLVSVIIVMASYIFNPSITGWDFIIMLTFLCCLAIGIGAYNQGFDDGKGTK